MKNVDDKWTVQDMPLQEGRLAVVTGATSGIGFHSAKELARKGATVIMPARDMRKAKEAAGRIEAEVPKAQLYLVKLDLSEFDSVREFGEHLRHGKASLDLPVRKTNYSSIGPQPRRRAAVRIPSKNKCFRRPGWTFLSSGWRWPDLCIKTNQTG